MQIHHAILSVFLCAGTQDAPPGSTTTAPRQEPSPEQEPAEPDYSHPLGIEFDHAQGWKVEETELGLSLVPPDLVRTLQGPAEYHVMAMIGADPKVRSLDDKRAAQLLTELMARTLPFMKPKGKAQKIDGRPEARRFDFQGVSPTGEVVECRVQGLLLDGWFLSLTSLGSGVLLDRRDPALREVLTSLELEDPKAAEELAGTWYSESFSSAGGVRDRLNTTTKHGVTLQPDGRVRSTATTGVSGRRVVGVTEPSLEDGRWACVGDQLWVVWREGGAARWTVYVQGARGEREMLLTSPDGRTKVLWTETR